MKVYNGASFLEYSVNSILQQTLKDFEFIIVDDGSTDETWPILENLARSDPRIILRRNTENEGVPRAANRALSMVSTPFVACQDADDWSYPDRLEIQLRYLKEHGECVAVGSWMMMVNSSGLPLRLMRYPQNHTDIDFRHMNGFGPQLPHPTLMTRTKAMLLVNGYKEEFPVAEDYELLLRLAEVGELRTLSDVLVRYTRHEKNISWSKRETGYRYKRKALFQAWERRGMGYPHFEKIPNPSLKFRDGSRMVALFIYGLKKILSDPGSPEGWLAFRGAATRIAGKRGKRSGGKT